MPKVSIIMGVYNAQKREKILSDSINSILNQTFKDFEFIICDDGSDDRTLDILHEYEKNDSRIKILKNVKNMGLAYTLNKCLKYCKGDYIARMDDDDISRLNRLEKQVEFLNQNYDYDLVAMNVNLFDENGIWGEKSYPEKIKKEDFLFTSPITHPTIMVRKKAFDKVDGYKEKWYTNRTEDYDLFMRMFCSGVNFYIIQDKLFDYREDKNCYQKRKYKYRINECVVRVIDFGKLKLYPKAIPYVLKPLIVGLLPSSIIKKIHR